MSDCRLVLWCVALVMLCGCRGREADPIVGKWQTGAGDQTLILDFAEDGKLTLTGNPAPLAFALPFAKTMNDFRVVPHAVPLTYQVKGVGQLEIAADLSKLLAGLAGNPEAVVEGGIMRASADVRVGPDELMIRKGEKSVTFKRAK